MSFCHKNGNESLGYWLPESSKIVDLKLLSSKILPDLPVELIKLKYLLRNQKIFSALLDQAKIDETSVLSEHNTTPRAVVPLDTKIIGVARNFWDPLNPNKIRPSHPIIFVKPSNTVIGPYDSTHLPHGDLKTVIEGEIGVIIGVTAKNVKVSEASQYIFGFTSINDLSDKSTTGMFDTFPLTLGKYFDGYLPCSSSLLIDPSYDFTNKNIKSYKNDNLVQNQSTKDMYFTIPELISFISSYITLEPGDCILTGTPCYLEGQQNNYIMPGDVVQVEIEGLDPITTLITEKQN